MATSILSAPQFHNEEAAYAWVEARVWANGRVCPHCGTVDNSGKLQGKSTRIGTYKCYACRKPFTVKVGTIFEASHVKMTLWLQAIYLMVSSKKGVSSNQLHRTLGVTLKTAWFMSHRIREAMKEGKLVSPMGGEGKTVEADETYIGGKEKNRHKSKRTGKGGAANKETVFSLVEREGRVRSFHVKSVKSDNLRAVLRLQMHPETALMTDSAGQYRHMHKDFKHETVNHEADEYVRGDVHTNTIEGYFSIMKRGINGVFHHVSEQHLARYLAEFDFRYNNRAALGIDDVTRADEALKRIVGKRLTYRTTNQP
jgi:transposase-like protein